jgi:hypothetical protein
VRGNTPRQLVRAPGQRLRHPVPRVSFTLSHGLHQQFQLTPSLRLGARTGQTDPRRCTLTLSSVMLQLGRP